MKKGLAICLVIFWCCLIFGFSNENQVKSSSLTKEIISSTVSFFTNIDKNSEEMKHIIKVSYVPIRKCAHFFMYFCLSFFIMNVLYLFGVKKYTLITTSIFCIGFAITDEFHQLFVDGRCGSIIDVLLDSSASLLSAYLYHRFIIMRVYYGKAK